MYLFMHMYKMNTGMFFSALFTDDYVSADSLRSDFQIVFGWFFFFVFWMAAQFAPFGGLFVGCGAVPVSSLSRLTVDSLAFPRGDAEVSSF